MVTLRLARFGAKKKPFYRVVAADSRGKRDGRFIELLGTYDPRADPIAVKLDIERVEYWVSVGARMSNAVKRLVEITREQADGVTESPKALKKKAKLAKKEAEKATAAEEKAKAAEDKPAEEKPAKEKQVEEKPAEEKPADKPEEAAPEAKEKPVEEKPAEEKPAEDKPVEENK